MEDADDQVIDLADYLARREETARQRSAFSFHGGDGERSRFALPLWRASYLGSGMRAALVSLRTGEVEGQHRPTALVVLDLAEEPARVDFEPSCLSGLVGADSPGELASSPEAVGVYLGEADGLRWYLVVDDLTAPEKGGSDEISEHILFLAGECAGLLLHRGLASGTGDEPEPTDQG